MKVAAALIEVKSLLKNILTLPVFTNLPLLQTKTYVKANRIT